jgi:glyoxylase-like metal-dependent hydrolase (beta-lactamase superfamily II)
VLQVFQVTPRIWCARRPSYLTCSYVVSAGGGLVLVDAGMDSEGKDMERLLHESFRARPQDVRAILLTHWHNDHAAGAAAIRARSASARVQYHAADRPQLVRATARPGLLGRLADAIPEHGPLVLFKGLLGEAAPRAVEADRLVADGEVLEEEFEVIGTPGHTPGHLSFLWRPERALFAGDALAVVGGRVRFMARNVTPDRPEAWRSMERLLGHSFDVLCPGHREPLTRDVPARCEEMRRYLASGAGGWPFLG